MRFRVTVGTVAELVEEYRQHLVTAFNMLAVIPKDGQEQPIIPSLGEPSLRLQTECFDRNGIVSGISPAFMASPEEIQQYEEHAVLCGRPPYRQNLTTRIALMQAVSMFTATMHNDEYNGFFNVPAESPEQIQQMIDALTTFKEDIIARKQLVMENTSKNADNTDCTSAS